MKTLKTENTTELYELVIKYQADEQAIENLRNELSDANAKLKELEEDITGDIDEGAKQAVKLSAKVNENQFKVNAMTKRCDALKATLIQTGQLVADEYRIEQQRLSRERSQAVKTLLASDDFARAIELLHAAYELSGRRYWDTLLNDANITTEPNRAKSEAAAKNLGIDTDYNLSVPDALTEAGDITGHQFNMTGMR